MERRNLALLCAGVLCFWLFALAVGTAQGAGLRVAIGGTGPAVQADAPVVLAAAPANAGRQSSWSRRQAGCSTRKHRMSGCPLLPSPS